MWQYFDEEASKHWQQMREQLCVHMTGIGKTRSMIEMLNDSYTWQVAKVVIVPKLRAVTKFLCEIVPWPTKVF